MAITLNANKFLATLTNLIAYVATNDTLSGRGVLPLIEWAKSVNIDYGDSILLRSVDLPEVEDYDEAMSLTEVKKPTVDEQVISIKDYKVIRLSINRWFLPMAFLSSYALNDFASYVLSTMRASRDKFIYEEIISCIEGWTPVQSGQTLEIELTDTASLTGEDLYTAEKANARKIAKALKNTIDQFNAFTSDYNDLGYTEQIAPGDMDLIINNTYNTDLIVDAYAVLFNSNLITDSYKWGKTIVIPSKQLSDENTIGYFMHRGKVRYGYGYEVQTNFFNPANLIDTSYLHFNYYIDSVKALPGIKIVKG